jgi:hypothetical protein
MIVKAETEADTETDTEPESEADTETDTANAGRPLRFRLRDEKLGVKTTGIIRHG